MSHPLTLDARELEVEPGVRPERYEGVRTRRVFAFLIDFAAVLFLMLVAYVVIAVLGIFTLGLLGSFFRPCGRWWPSSTRFLTVGGPHSATPGMRFMGIEMRTVRGERLDYGLALLHALGFWFSIAILTPLVLLVALFTERKQLLHDLVLGTVAVRFPY